jgi:hypothetical protein
MSEEKKKEEAGPWAQLIGMFVLRLMDSGLAPWVAVALFLLGMAFIIVRNLDSKDSLTFLQGLMNRHGVAWVGWLVAFIEIPIFRASLKRARERGADRRAELERENEKARKMLTELKQGELKLEPDSPGGSLKQ